jgi:hypothetical protein
MSNGRRQPSRGGTSRMTRECQVRFCERLGVKFPGPTRQVRAKKLRRGCVRCSSNNRRNGDEAALTLRAISGPFRGSPGPLRNGSQTP